MDERSIFTDGEVASLTKVITVENIEQFAKLSRDFNPVHIDEAFAETTYFQGRIAHGMLIASLISTVLGNKLPGFGSIYIDQTLHFLAPVRPGDEVTARVEVNSWDSDKGRITLSTEVSKQDGNIVLSGKARLVMSHSFRDV